MIRIYCQYSYGGYKTFFLRGEANEEVANEVTNDTPFDFPADAHLFFQFGGTKMAYKQLHNGEHTLVLREIPSIHTDSDGRSIPCALQLIGQDEDRKALDNLAVVIADDLQAFEAFFSKLFYVKQGLHFHGDQLRAYLDRSYGDLVCTGEVHPVLKKVVGNTDKVHLFVPLSKKFGIDDEVTHRTRVNLQLEAVRNYITLSELIGVQHNALPQLGPLPQPITTSGQQATTTTSTESDEKDGIISSLKQKNAELTVDYNNAFENLKQLDEKLKEKDEVINSLSNELQKKKTLVKYILVGCGILFLLLIIATCSGSRSNVNGAKAQSVCVNDSL